MTALTDSPSLAHLRERHLAAAADPSNPYLIASLDAAVRLHDASEYLRREAERAARKRKSRHLPEGYTKIRGEKPYEWGFVAPDGVGYGFWVSPAAMREEAWQHLEDPDDFEDPEEVDQDALPPLEPVVARRSREAYYEALRTVVRVAVGEERFAALEREAAALGAADPASP